jgi:type II secretory pathway pseudopilin PulG
MSEPERSSKSKKSDKNSKPGNPARDWIIRGVVFGILGVLLIVALLDFQAKQSATKTAEAWRAALRDKGETADLTKSEMDKIPVSGSPSISKFKSPTRSTHANEVDTYTWKGTIRTYVVKVSYGLGNDPTVEEITGPGEAQ